MIGILIDPRAREVTAVTLPADGVSLAPLIDCEHFDCVMLRHPLPGSPGAALYVDDVGMTVPDQHFWCFVEHPDRIFAGKGLITAVNVEGDACDGVADPEEIAPHVVWRAVRFAGIEEHTEEDVEIAPGVRGFKLTRECKFEPLEEE